MGTNLLEVVEDEKYKKIMKLSDTGTGSSNLVEETIFASSVKKINSVGKIQTRIIIMTTHHVFSFNKKSLGGKMEIKLIKAIVESETNGEELVIHIPSEYDYGCRMTAGEDFISML